MQFFSFNPIHTTKFYTETDYKPYISLVSFIHENYLNKKGDSVGWLDYTLSIPNEEIISLLNVTNEIQTKADILLIIGIGGSYLGSHAVIEALNEYQNLVLLQNLL